MLDNSPVIEQAQIVENGDKCYVFRVMRVGCSTETEYLHQNGTWYGSVCRDGVDSGYYQTVEHAQRVLDVANKFEVRGMLHEQRLEAEVIAARAVKRDFPIEVEA